ncbi:helix-turn-helix transcriptional regulator [Amycolatopsis pithecellobii]|uniref:LuxR family transcriptional regulator n=1 Tax=Amycolatopsis pithecellobii TaxID=664692 RepID=A0A6N7YZ21_9PSEU|nr:LuxR C-terminal-related transcriptional regulator [Amycolatopsis pithecellobii]MTD52400.1 LuxR family transcriptional regulator [Amycolatopsis pithecellobii]
MSRPSEQDAVDALSLVGRDHEIARVSALLAENQAVVVSGDWGSGKTALLDVVARDARRLGRSVVRLSGRRNAAGPVSTVLRQLVPAPKVPLVVVDDADRLDSASRQALASLSRQPAESRAELVLSVDVDASVPEFEQGHPVIELEPLDLPSAHLLLDRQPHPPTGRARLRVLDQAAGNPLALIELARNAEDDRHLLSPSRRLERALISRLAGLPAGTRAALLLAATDPVAGGLHEVDPGAWAPAERAGLVRFIGQQVHFRHPLLRAAVYHNAPLEQRREAHLTLARALTARPDRQAWHAAEAARRPDEGVAVRLASAADRVLRDEGYAAAATIRERAGELSPAAEDRAMRLVEAACHTIWLRQPQWTHDLLRQADVSGADPVTRARAVLLAGRALALNHRYAAALSVLSEAVEQVADSDPVLALDMLGTGAVVAYHSGSPAARDGVRRLLGRVTGISDNGGIELRRAWTSALIDPIGDRATLIHELPRLAERAAGDPQRLIAVGTVAWLLDETPRALDLFDDGLSRWRAHAPIPHSLVCAAWSAYFEMGQWDTAHAMAEHASAETAIADLPEAAASALLMRASVLALRGQATSAIELATDASALIDPMAQTMLGVRTQWVLGAAAVADGDHDAAFHHFRSAFTAEGEPVHFHASYAVLADLAAAAARIGRSGDVAPLLDMATRALGGNASPRLASLLHRAAALSAAEEVEAERHFRAALEVERWPFEHAQLQLDYGEWLRRRRRIVEARPLLLAAVATFRRLGAGPWTRRAEAELRAAGVGAPDTTATSLSELTTQQQQIVRLASRGMTNREIGEQLFLSRRTVESHLYRSFPKLGVTSRAQLRDLLPSD